MRPGDDRRTSAAPRLEDVLSGTHLTTITTALTGWLPQRRWFQGKARILRDVRVADAAVLDGRVLNLLVDVAYATGPAERYQVPLAAAESPEGELLVDLDGLGLVDALTRPDACRVLAAAATGGVGTVTTVAGSTVESRPVTGEAPGSDDTPRLLGAEQSNSSVVFGDRFILKVLRRIEPGIHPDVELTRGLTEAGFAHVPAQHGSCELLTGGRPPTALLVIADFVSGGREGWQLATAEARALGSPPDTEARPAASGTAAGTPADRPSDLLRLVEELGAAVAAMHATLGAVFGITDVTAEDLKGLETQAHSQVDAVLDVCEQRAPQAAAAVLARRDDLHAMAAQLAALPPQEAGSLVRVHGDLHLGQVLLDSDDRWQLLDFEGEPARPLAERRLPGPPLRDVAGMLRSFDYAAAAGADDPAAPLSDTLVGWRDTARRLFLAGYLREAGGLVPEPAAAQTLLSALELDKAVYELGYELANRPSWLPIPVGGILRVVDSGKPGRHQ